MAKKSNGIQGVLNGNFIAEWSVFVYVIRSLIDGIEKVDYINKSDINVMWLGGLYKNRKDIPSF